MILVNQSSSALFAGVRIHPEDGRLYSPVAIVKRNCPRVFTLYKPEDMETPFGFFRLQDLDPNGTDVDGIVYYDVVLVSMSKTELKEFLAKK